MCVYYLVISDEYFSSPKKISPKNEMGRARNIENDVPKVF